MWILMPRDREVYYYHLSMGDQYDRGAKPLMKIKLGLLVVGFSCYSVNDQAINQREGEHV